MEKRKGLIVFIVDDELTARETLANDLKRFEAVGEVHTFTSYAEATLPLLDLQPDILFLDVEVPGRTGPEFLDAIRPRLNLRSKQSSTPPSRTTCWMPSDALPTISC